MPSMSPPVISEKLLKLIIKVLKEKKMILENADEDELINQVGPNMPRLTKDTLVNDPSLLDRIATALIVSHENLKGSKLLLDMEKYLRLTTDDNVKELQDMTKLILDHVAKKNPEVAKKLRLMIPPVLLDKALDNGMDKDLDKSREPENSGMKNDKSEASPPTLEPGKPKKIIKVDDAGNFIGFTSSISTSGAAGDNSINPSEDASMDFEDDIFQDEITAEILGLELPDKKKKSPHDPQPDNSNPSVGQPEPSMLDLISDELSSALDTAPRLSHH